MIEKLEYLLLAVGLLTVLVAYGKYIHRSGDWSGFVYFWQRKLALSVQEFKLQRWGIAVMFVAVILRIVRTVWWP